MASVLVGCETSGVVRQAFLEMGHDAWSCDLLPADDLSPQHIIGDIRDVIHSRKWDIGIFHPPCTRLCNSGVRWLHNPPKGKTKEQMLSALEEGVALFSACWNAPIERVAIENPIMHCHAKNMLPADIPSPQIIQPWWFGDKAFKATGLYLRGLPRLTKTATLIPPKVGTKEHKEWSCIHRASPSPDRWKLRSKTFSGIAQAMAEQWTIAL